MLTSRDVSGVLLSLLIIHHLQYDNIQGGPRVSQFCHTNLCSRRKWKIMMAHLHPVNKYIFDETVIRVIIIN